MRVFILGGTGVFGSRLAAMLTRDGHEVLVAGRSCIRAHKTCQRVGGAPVMADRNSDLARALNKHRPDVVVDAAGPFQAYGDDPYKVARAALAAGAHYLDFSDDGAFCEGISELDEAARRAGRCVLSGVSSVPALSSAIVADLAQGLSRIDLIDMAILPGNRAPRGRSVIEAILHQMGRDIPLWVAGRWTSVRCWSRPATYDLGAGIRRRAAIIGAPDLRLFPDHFKARTVLFRAGLELGILQQSLAVISWLRARRWIPDPLRFAGILQRVAGWLEPFGSDTGGMQVQVAGSDAQGRLTRQVWSLLAKGGDGPNIPAIPALHLINAWARSAPEPGARVCLAEFSRLEIEATLTRLNVVCNSHAMPLSRLFEQALGSNWARLPAVIRDGHRIAGVQVMCGRAEIDRGTHPLARLIGALFRFPGAGHDIPVEVTMEQTGQGETWTRNFAGRTFRSHLSPSAPGQVLERFGPLAFQLGLPVENGALAMPVQKGWCLGVPIPRWLLPKSETREYEQASRFHFDVRLSAPIVGLLVHYRGWLEPIGSTGPQSPHVVTSGTDPRSAPNPD